MSEGLRWVGGWISDRKAPCGIVVRGSFLGSCLAMGLNWRGKVIYVSLSVSDVPNVRVMVFDQ